MIGITDYVIKAENLDLFKENTPIYCFVSMVRKNKVYAKSYRPYGATIIFTFNEPAKKYFRAGKPITFRY